MNDTLDRMYKLFGEEAMKKRDDAGWALKDVETELVKGLSDDDLRAVVGDLSNEDVDKWHEQSSTCVRLRLEARLELMYRRMDAMAKEALDRPGSSGCFCVYHNCDLNECGDRHDQTGDD